MARTGERTAAVWQGLNERQRAYLEVAYAVDREGEEYQRSAWSRGGRAAPPGAGPPSRPTGRCWPQAVRIPLPDALARRS